MTWSSTATRGLTGPRRPLGELGDFGSLAFSIPLGFRTGRPFLRQHSWSGCSSSCGGMKLASNRRPCKPSPVLKGEAVGMSQGEALAEGFYWYAEKLME